MDIGLYLCPSEWGGGKAGASLGPEAVLVAASFLGTVPKQPLATLIAESSSTAVNRSVSPFQKPRDKHLSAIATYGEEVAAGIKDLRCTKKKLPLVLTGDHSSAAGIIGGLLASQVSKAPLGVVWIDAHPDMQRPHTSVSGNVHGMPLAAAMGLPSTPDNQADANSWQVMQQLGKGKHLRPENLVLVGVRDIDPPEQALINKYNIHLHDPKAYAAQEIHKQVEDVLARLSHCKEVFVSFDIDVMDSSRVPGTGTPVAKGLIPEVAIALNKALVRRLVQEKRLAAWELTELNPLLDNQGQTVGLGAEIFLSVLDAFWQK